MSKEIEVQKILTRQEAADLVAKVEANIQLHQENLQEEGQALVDKLLAQYSDLREKAKALEDRAEKELNEYQLMMLEALRIDIFWYMTGEGVFKIGHPTGFREFKDSVSTPGDQIVISSRKLHVFSVAAEYSYSVSDSYVVIELKKGIRLLNAFIEQCQKMIGIQAPNEEKGEQPKSGDLIPVRAEEEGFQWSPLMAGLFGVCVGVVAGFVGWLAR